MDLLLLWEYFQWISDPTPALHVLCHPRAPNPPRRGSRVARVRESGKRSTIALRAGSASFTEVNQNKSGSHYIPDLLDKHQKTTSTDISIQTALNYPQKRKQCGVWAGLYDSLWVKFRNRQQQTWQHKGLLLELLFLQRALWWHQCLMHTRQSFHEWTGPKWVSRCCYNSCENTNSTLPSLANKYRTVKNLIWIQSKMYWVLFFKPFPTSCSTWDSSLAENATEKNYFAFSL